jgi:predicted ATPase/DNA-binding SARP family transcriptional activator
MPKKPIVSIHARVLGDASISTGVATIEPIAEIVFAAALYLIVRRKEPVTRGTIQALLWPDASAHVAAHRMRQTLLKLRRLGMPIELGSKGHVGLNGAPVSVDYEEFLSARTFENGSNDSLVMLPGYEPRFSQPYLEWLDAYKAEVNASLTRVMLGVIARHRVKGEWVEVERTASRLLRFQPYNEEATLAMAEACAMRGGKLDAMAILDRYLSEVGNGPTDLRVPATIMRRRIADRMHPRVEAITGQSPLVGRGAEMEQLGELLERAREKDGQACIVWGEAGVGKSRLLAEFSTFASLQGVATQRVQCRPSDPHRPLSIFVDLVPGLRTMRGAIGCSPETFRYLDRLTKHRPTLDPKTNEEDSEFVYAKVHQALFDLVDAVSDEGCLIILVEDVHWLDSTSAKLLREMMGWAPDHSILFAFTGRNAPEGWLSGNSKHLTEIRLTPLAPGPSKDVVLGVVRQRGRDIEETYLDWCVNVAEGNPYFLQELANQWVERGDQQSAPPSLAAVLNDRIARLGPDALLLLQTCALLETNSTVDRIERVIDFEAHRMIHAINDLGIAGMLVIESDGSGSQSADKLLSRHDLLSNAALGRLTPPARAFLHRRIGGMFESEITDERSTSVLWDCANHWQLAGNIGRALELARSCATHLMDVGMPAAAAEAYEQSLAYCSNPRETLEILEAQTHAYYRSRAWNRVSDTVLRARRVRFSIEPERDLHDELELMALRAEWRTLRHDRTLAKALQCLNEVTASAGHRVEAGCMALMLMDQLCDHDGMAGVYTLVQEVCKIQGVSCAARFQAALVFHTTCGNIETAVHAARSLIEEQRSNGNVGDLFRSLCNAVVSLRTAGLFDEAEAALLEALAVAERHKIELAYSEALALLALMALERGRNEEARRWWELLRVRPAAPDDKQSSADLVGIPVRLALLSSRPSDARRLLPRNWRTLRDEPGGFHRAYQASLFVAAELACGRIPSNQLLAVLEDAHLNVRRGVYQAFPTYALYVGLRAAGQDDRGSNLLNEYITTYRRERWPEPSHLLAQLEKLLPLACKSGQR